jgi:hypothetical protein
MLREKNSHLKDLYQTCLNFYFPVTTPIALISQIQRSGGTLLSQLFDGHPEIHAHPYELKIGYPKKYIWPKIDLNDRPEKWFNILFEEDVIQLFKEGYRKSKKPDRLFPFLFPPSLQKKIFLNYLGSFDSIRMRAVFDAYMTSYFGAWLNNQNYAGDKKFVTAFTPRLSEAKDNMEAFFAIYPDGRLISIVRDPKNWFASASRWETKKRKYNDIEHALNQWKKSVQSTAFNRKRFGERVCIIRFEDLIGKCEPVMRYLSDFLNIKYDDILLTPTFNKYPIDANTSFKAEKAAIVQSTLTRYKTLPEQDLETIEQMTQTDYEVVQEQTVNF